MEYVQQMVQKQTIMSRDGKVILSMLLGKNILTINNHEYIEVFHKEQAATETAIIQRLPRAPPPSCTKT